MKRRLRHIIRLSALTVVFLFGLEALPAKTIVAGGLSMNWQKRVTNRQNYSGIDFGPSLTLESGFFPGNIAMSHTFTLATGTLSGLRNVEIDHSMGTFVHTFKYYFPHGRTLGGFWRRSVYKIMDMVNPYVGPALGITLDLGFENAKTGKQDFANELDYYMGFNMGATVRITKTLVIMPEFQYLLNLMPDDSDKPGDDLNNYGHMAYFGVSVGYLYDL